MTTIQTIIYDIANNDNIATSATIQVSISESQEKQMYCIHRALKNQLTNSRIRNASTKTRSEVRGGGKKPWKQKGTGRARAGSIRSPLWKGGGIIFGPKQKIYKSKLNKKEKELALNNLLYNKQPNTKVINNLIIPCNEPKTKKAVELLHNLGIQVHKDRNILIVVEKKTKLMYMSFRNLPNIELIEAKHLNIISLLRAEVILITKHSLNIINQKST